MKTRTKIASIFTCLLTTCMTFTPLSINAIDTGTVSANLNANNSLTEQTFNLATFESPSDIQQIGISLNTNSATAVISGDINTALSGSVDEVICDDGSIGYVGVYDGHLSDGTTIVADVVYNEDDVFAALTLGTLGDDGFSTTFYGEFTDSLKAISNKHAENTAESRAMEAAANSENDLEPRRINSQTVYQGEDTAYESGYEFGTLSFFFPDEMYNSGNISVYAKVTTNCDEVEDYLTNEQGYDGALVVYADTFDIFIKSNHNDLHVSNNSYLPVENTTYSSVPLPYYTPAFGWGTIEVPVETSHIDVTLSENSSASHYPDNNIHWEFEKVNGWNPSETDGDPESESGMPVSVVYTYGGNMSSSHSTSLRAEASVRYEFQHFVAGSTMKLHLWTDEMMVTSLIKIYP